MIMKACVEWPSVIDSLVYLCRVLLRRFGDYQAVWDVLVCMYGRDVMDHSYRN